MRRYMTRADRLVKRRAEYKARTEHKRAKMIDIGLDTLVPAGPPKQEIYQFVMDGKLQTILAPSALVARQILAERLGVHYKHFHPLPAEPVKDKKNPWGTVEEQAQAATARITKRDIINTLVLQVEPSIEKPAAKDVNFDFNSED